MNRRVFRGPAWYPFNAPLAAQAASIPSKSSSSPPDYPQPPRPASRYRRPLALIPVSSASSTIIRPRFAPSPSPAASTPRGLSHQPLSRRYVAVARPRDSSSPPPPSREATETSTYRRRRHRSTSAHRVVLPHRSRRRRSVRQISDGGDELLSGRWQAALERFDVLVDRPCSCRP